MEGGAGGGVVGGIAGGNDGIDAVIGSAQEEEEDLLDAAIGAGLADATFGESALHDEGDVGEGGEGGAEAERGGVAEEAASGQDLGRVHGRIGWATIVPGNAGW